MTATTTPPELITGIPDHLKGPQVAPGEQAGGYEAVNRDFLSLRSGHEISLVAVPMESEIADSYDVGAHPVTEIQAGRSRFVVFDTPDDGLLVARAHRAAGDQVDRSSFIVDRSTVQRVTEESMVIGRDDDDPRYSGDLTLSRTHFKISKGQNGEVLVSDAGSLNGTSVRAQYYPAESTRVSEPTGEDPRKAVAREFDEAMQRGSAPLTNEILREYPELKPTTKVVCGGKEFFLSDVIGRSIHRPKAVMYTEVEVDGKKVIAPRMLYISNSDGGWRVTYGLEEGMRIMKEAHSYSHYTQETKLARGLLEALDTQERITEGAANIAASLNGFFLETRPDAQAVMTGAREIEYYHSDQSDKALKSARVVSAGMLGSMFRGKLSAEGYPNVTEYFRGLDQTFRDAPGFLPDFRRPAMSTYTSEHTILGPVQIEEFPAEIDGRTVMWSMASDDEGRVWIENVYFPDSNISSYGNRSEVLDMGIMTSKPLDYRQQADMLQQESERRELVVNGTPHDYVDITPALDNLLPIAFYREARGIGRKQA